MPWQQRQHGRPAGNAQDRWFAFSPEYQAEKAIRKDLRMLHDGLRRWNTQPHKEAALQAIDAGLACGNVKIQLLAARCLLLMEKQNQADEIEARKQPRLFTAYQALAPEAELTPADLERIEAKRQRGLEEQRRLNNTSADRLVE